MKEIIRVLSDVCWENTSHIGVSKKVFFSRNDLESNITQIAFSELKKGNMVSSHIHKTMEEIFIMIEGKCEFHIDSNTFLAKENSIIRIPSNVQHSLKAVSDCKFYYFGVSI